jgi:hypothetical protein
MMRTKPLPLNKDTDTRNYYPLQGGVIPPSSLYLRVLPKDTTEPKNQLLLFTEHFDHYQAVRDYGRATTPEAYYRHYLTTEEFQLVMADFIAFLKEAAPPELRFSEETPGVLTITALHTGILINLDAETYTLLGATQLNKDQAPAPCYIDAFDAVAAQTQCDWVIHLVDFEKGTDAASLIYLFYPNGWSANSEIGKSFADIHAGVLKTNGQPFFQTPAKLAQNLAKLKGWVERVGAISFRLDTELVSPPIEEESLPLPPQFWYDPESGKDVEILDEVNDEPTVLDPNAPLFIRFERQVVRGLQRQSGFIFGIHTFHSELTRLDRVPAASVALHTYRKQLQEATSGMGKLPEVYAREALADNIEAYERLLANAIFKVDHGRLEPRRSLGSAFSQWMQAVVNLIIK